MLKKVSLIESWPVLDQDNVFRSDCVQQKCKECKCCTWVKRKASRNSVMCPTIRLVLNMAANKNKEFLFFGFYKFLFFAKYLEAKTKNWNLIKLLPFFQFSWIFTEKYWNFVFKNSFLWGFYEKFTLNWPQFGIFLKRIVFYYNLGKLVSL